MIRALGRGNNTDERSRCNAKILCNVLCVTQRLSVTETRSHGDFLNFMLSNVQFSHIAIHPTRIAERIKYAVHTARVAIRRHTKACRVLHKFHKYA